MIDYFDALMRSSGLVIESQSPAPVAETLRGNASSAGVESTRTDVEPAAAHEPQPTPVAARHESPKARAEDQPVERNQSPELPRVAGVTAIPPSTAPAPNAISAMRPPSSPAPEAPVRTTPVQDLADPSQLVRAALEWVTGGPKPPAREQLPTPAVPTGVPSTGAAVTNVDTERRASPRPGTETVGVVHPPHVERYTQSSSPGVDHSSAPPSSPPRELPSITVNPPRIASVEKVVPVGERAVTASVVRERPHEVEEVIEVSIGAIHVRVDAPAAQTPMTPPVRRDERPRSGSRDALRRRALRRI
jgi:hypothetical protein